MQMCAHNAPANPFEEHIGHRVRPDRREIAMRELARAFVYFEPATRYHRGAVFVDCDSAIQWAEHIAASREEDDWVLNVRIKGRWLRTDLRHSALFGRRERTRILR